MGMDVWTTNDLQRRLNAIANLAMDIQSGIKPIANTIGKNKIRNTYEALGKIDSELFWIKAYLLKEDLK